LSNVEAIEIFEQTKVLEWGLCLRWQLETFADLIVETLCHFFIGASECKIINLAQQKHFSAFENGRINGAIMRGAFESELGGLQDSRDVLFPQLAGFRMALKRMKNRED